MSRAINYIRNLKMVQKFKGQNDGKRCHYRHACSLHVAESGSTYYDPGKFVRVALKLDDQLKIMSTSINSLLTIDHLYAVDVTVN